MRTTLSGLAFLLCAFPQDPQNAKIRVALVGEVAINKLQVELMQRIEQVKAGGDILEDWEVLLLLMDHAADEAVAKKLGLAITPEQLKTERARVEKETRDPEMLKKIVELTTPFPGMFENLVIRSFLCTQMIRRAFSQDRKIHAKPLADAEALLKKAATDASVLAGAEGYIKSDTTQGMAHDREKAKSIADRIPPEAKVGEVCATVVEDPAAFYVVRLIERRIGVVVFEAVPFAKELFQPWRVEQLKTIAVDVLDPRLKKALVEKAMDHPIVARMLSK